MTGLEFILILIGACWVSSLPFKLIDAIERG